MGAQMEVLRLTSKHVAALRNIVAHYRRVLAGETAQPNSGGGDRITIADVSEIERKLTLLAGASRNTKM